MVCRGQDLSGIGMAAVEVPDVKYIAVKSSVIQVAAYRVLEQAHGQGTDVHQVFNFYIRTKCPWRNNRFIFRSEAFDEGNQRPALFIAIGIFERRHNAPSIGYFPIQGTRRFFSYFFQMEIGRSLSLNPSRTAITITLRSMAGYTLLRI